ncbi:MAG: DedA family protein, partial [Prevotellaceae bacterium]|nr:DedA family protein [Prevotellaceae bacterium]
DSLLFVAGALAALPTNHLNVFLFAGIIIIAAVLGDSVNFEIGKYFGAKIFGNPDSKIFKQTYLQKTHEFYEKHGGKTIILARFVPIIRTFAPFVAGMGRMTYKYFITHNIIGGIIWVTLFIFLGYFVGNLSWVQNNLKFLIVAIIFVSLLPPFIEYFRTKKPQNTGKSL